jgi:hypothetical protein
VATVEKESRVVDIGLVLPTCWLWVNY